MINEFEVREMAGVCGKSNSAGVVLKEREDTICLDTDRATSAVLTPSEARRLARQLCRLARRIEKRIGGVA